MHAPVDPLIRLLHDRSVDLEPGVTHPLFDQLLRHSLLDGREYFSAAVDDPNPLTDLRVRRDPSGLDMLILNLQSISSVLPDLGRQATRVAASEDLATGIILSALGVAGASDPVPRWNAWLQESPSTTTSMMFTYVNFLGSWEDAADIAVCLSTSPAPTSPFQDATAALVLALTGRAGYRDLFDRALVTETRPIEVFFTGLRWASVEVKRNRDFDAARSALARADACINRIGGVDDADRDVIDGMTDNFKALIELRSHNLGAAETLSDAATEKLLSIVQRETHFHRREQARYTWMALFNRGQLEWSKGQPAAAIARLEEVLEFARMYDPEILYTSLSALAVMLLQTGQPERARPFAEEAFSRVVAEYDAKLVTQVKKVLRRVYLEVGEHESAAELAGLGPYFWQARELTDRWRQ